jgi:two-component system chemotaxis response regulator CheB
MPSRASSERSGGERGGAASRPGAVKVLIVDDSPSARRLISEILLLDPGIEVVGSAEDGYEALTAVRRLRPDVVTMDLVMPRLDGLQAIRQIMAEVPTPVVVVAAPQSSGNWVFQAMEAGALTVLPKPSGPGSPSFEREARRLVSAVKLTAGASVAARRPSRPVASDAAGHGGTAGITDGPPDGAVEIVAVAASTGGPPAFARIVRELPADLAVPLLLVQHIASGFEEGLAGWLSALGSVRVSVARNGARLRAGEVVLAASGTHLGVSAGGTVILSSAPPIDGFRPSATFMFRGVAEVYGRRALGVMLTGMGRDGVGGLVELRRAGGHVIAQDEETSAVYGMPAAAVAAGAVDRVLPLSGIADAIISRCRRV